jgi:hypothetical protein
VTAETDPLEHVRRRYRFDEWRDTRQTDAALFIWRFFLSGAELPNRRLLRIENVDAPGLPPAIQSIWAAGNEETLDAPVFRVDVYEAPSRAEAHEVLLGRLAQFESPRIERKNAAGDISFGGPDDRVLLFSRGNIVALVRNAGSEIAPVGPVARELDLLLTAPREVARNPVQPEIRRAEVAAGERAPGAPVPLVIEAEDPLGRAIWFRLAAEDGDFDTRGADIFYTPEAEGMHEIEIAAVNENLGSARRQLRFET